MRRSGIPFVDPEPSLPRCAGGGGSATLGRRSSLLCRGAAFVSAWWSRAHWTRRAHGAALAGFLLALTGCGGGLPNLQRLSALPSGPICRVAVLPFSSETEYPFADAIAYKVFVTELNNRGNYLVAQEGDVRALYQQYRIFPRQAPTLEELKILASRLNVQVLITGNVVEMREDPAGPGNVNPVFAVQVQILDGRDAKTLWSTYHRRQGLEYQKVLHFGMIHSVTDLCREVTLEILNLWFEQGLTRCDILP